MPMGRQAEGDCWVNALRKLPKAIKGHPGRKRQSFRGDFLLPEKEGRWEACSPETGAAGAETLLGWRRRWAPSDGENSG